MSIGPYFNSTTTSSTSNNNNNNNNIFDDNNVVLCGRGNANSKNSGNIRFKTIVRANIENYINAKSRLDKALVIGCVANQLTEEYGMKFVNVDSSTKHFISELSSDKIHDKVSHAIRDAIKQQQKEQNQPSQNQQPKQGAKSMIEKRQQRKKQQKVTNKNQSSDDDESSSTMDALPIQKLSTVTESFITERLQARSSSLMSFDLFDLGSSWQFSDNLDDDVEKILQKEGAKILEETNISDSPLPVNSTTVFEYDDMERVMSILNDQYEM